MMSLSREPMNPSDQVFAFIERRNPRGTEMTSLFRQSHHSLYKKDCRTSRERTFNSAVMEIPTIGKFGTNGTLRVTLVRKWKALQRAVCDAD